MSTHTLPIYFAPLQGYTEWAYRNAHHKVFGGIDTYYTPFVRFDKDGFRNKDIRDISPSSNCVHKLVPQLIANDLDKADTISTLFIENHYTEIDINLGCPFPLIAKRHNGSGMLPYPNEVESLLKVVDKHPDIDFTVKMRLGWSQADECLALAEKLNKARLKHITLHPRLGTQQYKGEVDLEGFSAFSENCKHPLIYNGDIQSTQDIREIQSKFPNLAGVMIGRGLLAHPAMALEYCTEEVLTEELYWQKIKEMHKEVFNQYEQQIEGGEAQLLHKMKTFWEYLEPQIGHKKAKAIRKSKSLHVYWEKVNTTF